MKIDPSDPVSYTTDTEVEFLGADERILCANGAPGPSTFAGGGEFSTEGEGSTWGEGYPRDPLFLLGENWLYVHGTTLEDSTGVDPWAAFAAPPQDPSLDDPRDCQVVPTRTGALVSNRGFIWVLDFARDEIHGWKLRDDGFALPSITGVSFGAGSGNTHTLGGAASGQLPTPSALETDYDAQVALQVFTGIEDGGEWAAVVTADRIFSLRKSGSSAWSLVGSLESTDPAELSGLFRAAVLSPSQRLFLLQEDSAGRLSCVSTEGHFGSDLNALEWSVGFRLPAAFLESLDAVNGEVDAADQLRVCAAFYHTGELFIALETHLFRAVAPYDTSSWRLWNTSGSPGVDAAHRELPAGDIHSMASDGECLCLGVVDRTQPGSLVVILDTGARRVAWARAYSDTPPIVAERRGSVRWGETIHPGRTPTEVPE